MRTTIPVMAAMAALMAGAELRPIDEADLKPKVEPAPPRPLPKPTLTRQQRRAAEREALKDPRRWDGGDPRKVRRRW